MFKIDLASSGSPLRGSRGSRALIAAALLAACASGWADESASDNRRADRGFKPDAFFAQLGVAEEVTAGTAGAMWDVPWDKLGGHWSMYVEASVSRWQSRGGRPSESGILTQLALIPVFRYRLDEGRSRWFMEGGIGATVTSSIYRGGESRFSTAFNFGDHVGVGYSFGVERRSEIALRVQHFSNAGIKRPNPGKDFLQLRYVQYFD